MEETTYKSMQQAVRRALDEANQAADEESYGVGGLLLDARTGDLLYVMHNRVIQENALADPTAHGERQLVDLYFEEKARGVRLPEPKDVIIVTTLDPCYMCTGSILAAGFQAVIAAYDDNAGVNYDKKNQFLPGNKALTEKIKENFYYPCVKDGKEARAAFGKVPKLFRKEADTGLPQKMVADCFDVFIKGANKARDIVKRENIMDMKDPAGLRQDDEIIQRLRNAYPHALQYRCKDLKPDKGLIPYLEEACRKDKENGGSGNAVAFLDQFGNLLMCIPGRQKISPIQTPFMLTLRTYTKLRYDLGDRGRQYLCPTKCGAFIFYREFDMSAVSLADMGAYGSSIIGDGRSPKNLQYIVPYENQKEMREYIEGMADRYKNVLKPMRVEDQELADWRFQE